MDRKEMLDKAKKRLIEWAENSWYNCEVVDENFEDLVVIRDNEAKRLCFVQVLADTKKHKEQTDRLMKEEFEGIVRKYLLDNEEYVDSDEYVGWGQEYDRVTFEIYPEYDPPRAWMCYAHNARFV